MDPHASIVFLSMEAAPGTSSSIATLLRLESTNYRPSYRTEEIRLKQTKCLIYDMQITKKARGVIMGVHINPSELHYNSGSDDRGRATQVAMRISKISFKHASRIHIARSGLMFRTCLVYMHVFSASL